jgi:hypothetical protein
VNLNFKPKIIKRQEHRRTSAENWIFHMNTENPITSLQDKTFVAYKHYFLFTSKQKIIKPIHHFKYKNALHEIPCASDYPFRIPFDYLSKQQQTSNHPKRPILVAVDAPIPPNPEINGSSDEEPSDITKEKKKNHNPKLIIFLFLIG